MATPAQKAHHKAMARLLQRSIIDNPYIPHVPTPKQAELLLAPEREVFYGGAVGGGKSDALLMAALQYVTVPKYAAIIFRRTHSDLVQPGALIPRSHEWLDHTDAKWNEIEKQWTFPSGATVNFGYMKGPKDHFRYKSAEYIRQLWEEGTDFTEDQYTYVQSRSRRLEGMPVPIQTFMASNPDGPGAAWVQERFVPLNPDTGDPEPWRLPPGRRFIPSTLDDNPHLDTAEYDQQLALMNVVTRKQLRYGRWDVKALGGMYERTMTEVVPAVPPNAASVVRIRFWDLAGTKPTKDNPDPDWTRGLLLAYLPEIAMGFVEDIVSIRDNPGRVRETVLRTAQVDGPDVRVGMWQDPAQAGKDQVDQYARLLSGFTFTPIRASADKVTNANTWLAAAGNDLIRLVQGPHVRLFVTEAEAFPNRDVHDDIVDAMSGAWHLATRGKQYRIGRI